MADTDNFNRANNGDLGTNWTPVTSEGAFKVEANRAQNQFDSSDEAEYWVPTTPANNQYAQGVMTATTGYTTHDGPAAMLRAATAAQTYYRVIFNHQGAGTPSNNIGIGKKVTGTFTGIATRSVAWTDGDTCYGEINGTTIQAKINGVNAGASVTDASIASGQYGIAYSSEGSGQVGTIDDWEGGNLGAATKAPQPLRRPHRVFARRGIR